MEQITFKQCFKGAWVDGFNALRNRPLLSLAIAVVLLITLALSVSIRQLAQSAAQAGLPATYRFRFALMSLGVALVNLIAFSALGVQVLRYVVLGPEAAKTTPWTRDIGRYVWTSIQLVFGLSLLCIAISLVFGFVLHASGNGGSYALISTFIALLFCAATFVAIRLSLIYAQIAAGRVKSWRAAWQDSRGHFWSIFGVQVAVLLPLIFAGFVIMVATEVVVRLMPGATFAVLATLILQAVISVIWFAIACGAAGWLYHRYANRLLSLDAPPAGV